MVSKWWLTSNYRLLVMLYFERSAECGVSKLRPDRETCWFVQGNMAGLWRRAPLLLLGRPQLLHLIPGIAVSEIDKQLSCCVLRCAASWVRQPLGLIYSCDSLVLRSVTLIKITGNSGNFTIWLVFDGYCEQRGMWAVLCFTHDCSVYNIVTLGLYWD